MFGEFATNVALVLETGGAAVAVGGRKASPILADLAKARQAAKAAEVAEAAKLAEAIKAGEAAKATGFKTSDGKWIYPLNDGFILKSNETLQVGTKIDRYGDTNGSFVAPAGTPFENRSLPPDVAAAPLREYEVIKALPVEAGPATPWFGQAGKGIQYKTRDSIQYLIDHKYIKEVKK